jgi:hypothetical protein
MSDKVPQNKHFDNRYDNADLQVDRTVKDIAAGYTEFDEMRAYKMYLETLEVEARVSVATDKVKSRVMKADGTWNEEDISISDLIPMQSEFEQARRRVIVKLNKQLTTGGGAAKLKQLYAEFETESLFELSSKITNYLMDKQRRDRVATDFKFM